MHSGTFKPANKASKNEKHPISKVVSLGGLPWDVANVGGGARSGTKIGFVVRK